MNYIRKIALFIGLGATVAITPFAGQRTTLRIDDLMPNEVERMDYLAQQ